MPYHLNPAVNNFAPTRARQNGMAPQVSVPASSYLEARVLNLEEGHVSLREDMYHVRELYHSLSRSVAKLKEDEKLAHVDPHQVDVQKSRRDAVELKLELDRLKRGVTQSLDGIADAGKANAIVGPRANGVATPQTRGSMTSNGTASNAPTSNSTAKKSIPPHLRKKWVDASNSNKKVQVNNSNDLHEHAENSAANSPLISDGQVDPKSDSVLTSVLSVLTSASSNSPKTIAKELPASIEKLSLNGQQAWMPYHITTLAPFQGQIPPSDTVVTFHPDFLDNVLAGSPWSPGLRFVQNKGPCILKSRTYYQLDKVNDPYLPKTAGDHGAKLTAFFNKPPEDEFGHLLGANCNSYEDVPMFVLEGSRYVYYGNYSQTRWSDKLDHDTMATRVPQFVKEFWAKELTSELREKWVTEELKKHFFPKPEYQGRLFAPCDNETATTEETEKLMEKVLKHVRQYAEQLRVWERDANMKTALIKKQFILDAFNASDMDEPPALRLWWEYLECVGWKKDFYDLLVTLQARDAESYL